MAIKIKYRLTLAILSFLAFTVRTIVGFTSEQELDALKKLPPAGYDKRNRPPIQSSQYLVTEPLTVLIRLKITNIAIDDRKMEYTIQGTLQQKWTDKRLNFSVSGVDHVTLVNRDAFWRPNFHFYDAPIISESNELIRISRNGDVLFSSKVYVTLNCGMNLKYYPFDDQVCPLKIASDIYSNEDLILEWNTQDDTVQPVEASFSSPISQLFTLKEIDINQFPTLNSAIDSSEEFHTCIQAYFKFSRSFKHYLVQVFIPCCTLVFVSWISFWLDVESAATGRIIIGISSLFVMGTQISSFNARFPPTPSTKAIDVWTGICMTFAYAAFMEFAVAYYWARNERSDPRGGSRFSGSHLGVDIPLSTVSAENVNEDEPPKHETKNEGKLKRMTANYLSQFKTGSQKLDGVSRVAFPLFFILFIVIYFSYYLSVSGIQRPYNFECA